MRVYELISELAKIADVHGNIDVEIVQQAGTSLILSEAVAPTSVAFREYKSDYDAAIEIIFKREQ